MEFEHRPVMWDNEGLLPPEELKRIGFLPGFKPPAGYFNHVFHATGNSIDELQKKLDESQAQNENSITNHQGDASLHIFDAGCTFADNVFALELTLPDAPFFTVRFKAPQAYPEAAVFKIGDTLFEPEKAAFEAGEVLLLNFDKGAQKCYFASGSAQDGGDDAGDYLPLKNRPNIRRSKSNDKVDYMGKSALVFNSRDQNTDSDTGTNVQNGSIGISIGNNNGSFFQNCIAVGDENRLLQDSVAIGVGNNVKFGWNNLIVGSHSQIENSMNSVIAGQLNTVSRGNLQEVFVFGTRITIDEIGSSNPIGMGCDIFATNYGHTVCGIYAFASGYETLATGYTPFTAGYKTIANSYNFAIGKANKSPAASATNSNKGDLFVIGNGTDNGTTVTRSNALRVAADGNVYGARAFNATGADYAECFEWADGNENEEDRRGLFVTLDGEKIRLAQAEDSFIVGVISATPSIVSDNYADDWQDKYLRDIFGQRIQDEETFNWELNPAYDPNQDDAYIPRLERKEWAAVGLVGKLIVCDDGSCKANGYCRPGQYGIAVSSESGYRVMKRIDSCHVRILLK